MAVEDREEKKSDAGVEPEEASVCPSVDSKTEAVYPSQSLPRLKTSSNSSSYNLFKKVPGFRWDMPGGWNNRDITIFVRCCKEHIEDLRSSDENEKWGQIASSGAKRSHNPTLFTINSCMEVAGCLKGFIRLKKEQLVSNEAFQKFNRDIAELLDFFPEPNNVSPTSSTARTIIRSISKDKMNPATSDGVMSPEKQREMYEYFKTDSVADVLRDLMVERQEELITDGGLDAWKSFAKEVQQIFGVKCDMKHFLSSWKESFLFDICLTPDEEHKKELFVQCVSNFRGLFGQLDPKSVKDFETLNNSATLIPPDLKAKKIPHILPGSRYGLFNKSSTHSLVGSEPPPVELNNKENMLNTVDVLGEASSTTLAGDEAGSIKVETDVKVLSNQDSNSNEEEDESLPSDSNGSPSWGKNRLRKRVRLTPQKVLPARDVKNKGKQRLQNSNQDSPDTTQTIEFRGFDENAVGSSNSRAVRVPTKETVEIPNPDTTTVDDDSDSGFSNSGCRFSSNSCKYSSNIQDGHLREDKRFPKNPVYPKVEKPSPSCVNPDSTVLAMGHRLNESDNSSVDGTKRKRGRPVEKYTYPPAPLMRVGGGPGEVRRPRGRPKKSRSTEEPDSTPQQQEFPSIRNVEPELQRLPPVLTTTSQTTLSVGAAPSQLSPVPAPQPAASSSTSLALYAPSSSHQQTNQLDNFGEFYDRKPQWFDPFFSEMRNQQAWKLMEFKKMQHELLVTENKKISLLKKLVDKLD